MTTDGWRRALVFGAGKSGTAAAALLRRDGAEVRVLDGDDEYPGGAWDVAVASPGVPLAHPWQVAARAAGVPVISELELGARRFAGKMLAVTGSKGKSSVVKLVADGLNAAGVSAVACGNYGTPLCEVAMADPQPEWAVVEVSSFQMETTHPESFRPVAAAILNLQEDHLDRHGSLEAYHALKRKMLAGAARAVGAAGEWDECLAGSYFDNDVLRANGEVAAALMDAAGLSREMIARAFAAFEPLPHRMQKVAETKGVSYIDDSKATSLAALAAGVRMAQAGRNAPSVRLIAGGLPKGDNPNSVITDLLSAVKKVYLIGRCAEQFSEAWRGAVPCEVCGTLGRAVGSARRDARSGESVLLSPGAASFDQFESYGARGDAFASFVRAEAAGGGAETNKQG